MTRTQWLICIIASIGFAFDIYELLMLPLIIKPAVAALSGPLVQALGLAPTDIQGRDGDQRKKELLHVPPVLRPRSA